MSKLLLKPKIVGRLSVWLVVGMLAALLLSGCGDPTAIPATSTPLPSASPIPVTATALPPTASQIPATATVLPSTPVPTPSPNSVATLPPTPAAATQPLQPATGPGGKEYSYGAITSNNYGTGEEGYYIFEPTQPAPDKALPVIILLHGFGGVNPNVSYQVWISHLVRRGNIVIFPVYQSISGFEGEKFLENTLVALEGAFARLKDGSHVKPDLSAVVVAGYSAGGVIAANLTALATKRGLPVPKALFAITPGGCSNCSSFSIKNFLLGETAADFSQIRPDTKMLVLVGDQDRTVGETAAPLIWNATSQIPAANKNYIKVISDIYGQPPLLADHGMANRVPPNTYNYYGIWKLLDGLQSCAISGKFCEYALGNTPQQRNLGQWSDGTPVTPLKIVY